MRAARRGPGCGSGSHSAATRPPLGASLPRPRGLDLGKRRPASRSRGHMAEGDAGSDQRQVRPRRGADLQARLGLASPPRAASTEGPLPGAAPVPACSVRASSALHLLGAGFWLFCWLSPGVGGLSLTPTGPRQPSARD